MLKVDGSPVAMGVLSAMLLRERRRVFLTEVQKQSAVATLRRTANKTSVNDRSVNETQPEL